MEVQNLHLVSVSGYCLNVEEKSAVVPSLTMLRDARNFAQVMLWGKIIGTRKDYLIAYGFGDDTFKSTKYFYSLDNGATWIELPGPSAADVNKANNFYKRFTGDPAYEYIAVQKPGSEGEEAADNSPLIEEKRLAVVVRAITHESAVVPRGAFCKDAFQKIRPNPLFKGLTSGQASQLSSYCHFRDAEGAKPSGKDASIDVFESIERDEPKGVWSVKLEQGARVVLLRSLLWPGFFSYHAPAQAQFGWFYIGTGQKNMDIGYML